MVLALSLSSLKCNASVKKNKIRRRRASSLVIIRSQWVLSRADKMLMRMAMASGNAEIARGHFSFSDFPTSTINRKKLDKVNNTSLLVSNAKKVNLSASRKERINLPIYNDGRGISQFLSHPSGIEAMLNLKALQCYQFLDDNTYRCTLQKVRLLSFEAAPVLELRVTPTDKYCTVELISCKFEGSEVVERQNDHFSAIMTNHMTWDANVSEPFLEVDVKLNLTLEIYTRPFTLLPVSAVEGPGNLMMQTLVDRLVPLLLQQLLQDYDKWAHQQRENSP